jgi:DNA-binding transcriptional regulator YdaS (Cro superfamily)
MMTSSPPLVDPAAERLAAVRLAIADARVRKQAIAAHCGIKPCTLSNQLHGRVPMSAERELQILAAVATLAEFDQSRATA